MSMDDVIRSNIPLLFIVKGVLMNNRIRNKERKVTAKRKNEIVKGLPYSPMIFPAVQLKPQQIILRIMPN